MSMKVQVHDLSKDEALKEIRDLEKNVKKMVPQIEKLDKELSTFNKEVDIHLDIQHKDARSTGCESVYFPL